MKTSFTPRSPQGIKNSFPRWISRPHRNYLVQPVPHSRAIVIRSPGGKKPGTVYIENWISLLELDSFVGGWRDLVAQTLWIQRIKLRTANQLSFSKLV